MGVQLEPVSQGSFEQYGPWHFQDTRFQQSQSVELGTAFLRAAALPALNNLCEASKTRRANDLPQGSADKSSTRKRSRSRSRDLPASLSTSTITTPLTTTLKEFLLETQSLPSSLEPIAVKFVPLVEKVVLTFPLPVLPVRPRPNLKRRRLDTDVDGFNTAGLSSKKRRLRRHLITSRLSQPFSLPATHILNREVVASGDKRFLKLAAIMATRRLQPQPLPPSLTDPSSLLRRQAVFNRYRLRMCTEAAARGILQGATMAPRALVPYQPSHGMGMFPMGSSRHLPPVAGTGPSNPQGQEPARPAAVTPPSAGSSTPSPAPVPATSRLRIPSPRLRPLRSPELRVTRPAIALDDLEDLDDDGVAFPTSEHESRYEDEPDDVYADFGVIFGGGNGDGSDDEGGAEQFEDYMDDLDGIPWNARC